jgi:hypothetical protein
MARTVKNRFKFVTSGNDRRWDWKPSPRAAGLVVSGPNQSALKDLGTGLAAVNVQKMTQGEDSESASRTRRLPARTDLTGVQHWGTHDWRLPLRSTLAVTTALLLLLGIGVAEAADSTQLAETGGFLLGNAHRCGVPAERVEHAGKVIHGLIVAAAYDSSEAAAADSRFTEIFLASAFPNQDRDALIPPCTVVITQFDRLERHHQQAGME